MNQRRLSGCFIAVVLIMGCQKKAKDSPPPVRSVQPEIAPLALDDEAIAWWVRKANNSLRLNQPLSDFDGKLAPSSQTLKETARQLTDDAAFYDMLTDFSMYWFGIKAGKFWRNDGISKQLDPTVAMQFQIINGVLAAAQGGDYFSGLFTENGPSVIYEKRAPYVRGSDGNETNSEKRAKLSAIAQSEYELLLPLLDATDKKPFCDRINYSETYTSILEIRFDIGGLNNFAQSKVAVFEQPFTDWCFVDGAPRPENPKEKLAKLLDSIKSALDLAARIDAPFENREPLSINHIVDVSRLDPKTFGVENSLYGRQLFEKVPNSSTNRNRKRAAWVLKRFFCDDLTPINIGVPAVHSGGQHGSDPACYSCHYKLDPMAGHFRELGYGGQSFVGKDEIFFDDLAVAKRAAYDLDWKAPEGNSRAWNIGYIRSTVDDSMNTYGSNFGDLLALLRTAPEVRECFVKRVFEYTVGEEKSADRAWLREIADRMNETAKIEPTTAIKNVFIEMVTSKAFLTMDPVNNECYDFADGSNHVGRAPCRIASIIERNCSSCHNGSSAQGGLDLASWTKSDDGHYGFLHKRNGISVARQETLESIRTRLGSGDSSLRMPLMKAMSAQERQELYLWLDKAITAK